MKKKIDYTVAPDEVAESIESGDKILDFLPPPSELARRSPKIKVTITLSQGSVDFFKKYAKTNHTKYQTMINEVLDQYAQKYTEHNEGLGGK